MTSNYFTSETRPAFDRLRLTAARTVQPPRRRRSQSQPALLLKIIFGATLLAFLFFIGPWNNLQIISGNYPRHNSRNSADKSVAAAWETAAIYQEQHDAACQKRLDALDEIFNERRKVRQEATPTYEYKNNKMKFDLHEPEANCISEERFGSNSNVRYEAFGDGPKFVCGVDVLAEKAKKKNNCLVYSVGSNNDIRFEKAVHTHMSGCEIHTFDPTLADTPFVGGEYATFHPWGLGTDGGSEGAAMHERKNDGERMSFQTVIEKLGHTNRTIDILKIDCQGCEYASMPPLFDLIASGDVQVNQVLIELHFRGSDFTSKLKKFFSAADEAKMRIVHKERNQWGCDGYKCVEYALVSESFLRQANEAVLCSS